MEVFIWEYRKEVITMDEQDSSVDEVNKKIEDVQAEENVQEETETVDAE